MLFNVKFCKINRPKVQEKTGRKKYIQNLTFASFNVFVQIDHTWASK